MAAPATATKREILNAAADVLDEGSKLLRSEDCGALELGILSLGLAILADSLPGIANRT